MMDTNDIEQRIARLETLAVGLSHEVALWRVAAEHPLQERERKAYLAAVQDALAGLDAARVVLGGVTGRLRQRVEKGRG
jgi:hypothetical protein